MTQRRCRVCRCTQNNACVTADGSTCYWVEVDLCSACALLRDRCRAFLAMQQRRAITRTGDPVQDLIAFVLAERGRTADPALDETLPLVLYFVTPEDRAEFVAAVRAEKPNMITKEMP